MRAVLSSVFVLFLSAGFALAQAISIDEINRYLNGLKTAEGEFTQINADGTISTGQIYIHRPGRIRFEYNPPEETLVMAGGGQLAIFDGRAAGNPDQYPLKQTPLNLILARNIDLSRNEMIVGYREEGPATVVVAQDPDRPELGTIELVFTAAPVELRQWVITDETGTETTLVLGALERDIQLSSFLFNIVLEAEKWQ